MVGLWMLALLAGVSLVVYGFGPVFQRREQRNLIGVLQGQIDRAANEASGLPGQSTASKPPPVGDPVAILEIGGIRLQQAVVEGVDSSQTRHGPGHVPGTAGLGQPGNSVLVGRAHGFGGPFGHLDNLGQGDQILVTTAQGQSVYEVSSVRRIGLRAEPPAADDAGEAEATEEVPAAGEAVSVEEIYGPTDGNQLTLVTSASAVPWNPSRARIVVASLVGTPFAPTPQNGRHDSQSGLDGDAGATAAVVLAMAAYGVTMGASILLYQRFRPMTAYILTIGPVATATIVAGETVSRVFPAWM